MTYIGKCCREWVLAAGYPVGSCGLCGEVPTYLRDDDVNLLDVINEYHNKNGAQ